LENLEKELKEFKQETKKEFKHLHDKVDKLDIKVDKIELVLTETAAITVDNQQTLNELKPVITQMAANINNLTSHIDAFLRKAEKNEHEIEVTRYRMNEKFSEFDERITALEEKVS